MEQYLYVMESGNARVKVGISATPEFRRSVLEHAGGMPVRLIASYGPYRAASKLEAAVHALLARHRTIGEWFLCSTQDAKQAIQDALSTHQDDAAPQADEADAEAVVAVLVNGFAAPAQRLLELAEALMNRLSKKQDEYEALLAQFEDACRLVDEYAEMARSAQAIARSAIERAQPSLLN